MKLDVIFEEKNTVLIQSLWWLNINKKNYNGYLRHVCHVI